MSDDKNSSLHGGAKVEIFLFARKLRANMTGTEKLLWEELKERKLGVKFRRQHPFSTYVLDFYCHTAKLSVEIDGGYHNGPAQKVLDEERTVHITSLGVTEMRFTNKEIINDLETVIMKIKKQLKE